MKDEHLSHIANVEMALKNRSDGKMEWRTVEVKKKTKKVVLEALHQGMTQKEAAEEAGVKASRVSQIVKEAFGKGWVDEDNRLTSLGREKVGIHI